MVSTYDSNELPLPMFEMLGACVNLWTESVPKLVRVLMATVHFCAQIWLTVYISITMGDTVINPFLLFVNLILFYTAGSY